MKFSFIYFIGSITLFIGLLWMFLPHAYHEEILENVSYNVDLSHITHTVQGLILTLIGLIIMILVQKKDTAKAYKRSK